MEDNEIIEMRMITKNETRTKDLKNKFNRSSEELKAFIIGAPLFLILIFLFIRWGNSVDARMSKVDESRKKSAIEIIEEYPELRHLYNKCIADGDIGVFDHREMIEALDEIRRNKATK